MAEAAVLQPTDHLAAGEEWGARYTSATEELSAVAGIVNAGHGRLVDLTVLTLAEGHHVGPGLLTAADYLVWQTGISKATANKVLRIARRADELPNAVDALRAGLISLDQTDVIATLCPARYERSATELAKVANPAQLATSLSCYRDKPTDADGKPKPQTGVTIGRDEEGGTIRIRASHDVIDAFEQTLRQTREDLYRQRREDAKAAAAERAAAGGDATENPVDAPTREDAFASMTEAAARAAEAAHPGTDRYLVSYHLHLGPDGQLCLTDADGRAVPEAQRRRILCDCPSEVVLHADDGTPLSVGRRTRVIGRKLRRAILFRHRNRCAVPGCDCSVGLEIHHIVHWEDGGPTDTANLIALCHRHHKAHHQGDLDIEGDADVASGQPGTVEFRTPKRASIPWTNPPKPVHGPDTSRTLDRLRRELDLRTARRRHHQRTRRTGTPRPTEPGPIASTPCGERLDRNGIHLQADPQPPTPPQRT